MPKKLGIAVIAVGAVLILSALFLLMYNRWEDARAGQQSEDALASVEAAIAARPTGAPAETAPEETETAPTEPTLDPEMPTTVVGGYAYVGYLEIPALELKLPVMSTWDYTRLQIAPCRQFGSSRTDDLVIAAQQLPDALWPSQGAVRGRHGHLYGYGGHRQHLQHPADGNAESGCGGRRPEQRQ